MKPDNVTNLHPEEVTYRDHTITLTLRPRLNDWQYTFEHTNTITISSVTPTYNGAITEAQRQIDLLIGG